MYCEYIIIERKKVFLINNLGETMSYKEKLKKQKDEITKIEKVLKLYPDIEENRDRWGDIKFSSPSINPETDHIFINHNCGCCSDSPLQVWPYKTIEGIKVFSKPACFVVGEMNAYGSGERPYDNWEERFRKENIPETVIDQIQIFFNENKPEDCED